jgi:hypothetical protein
MTVWEKIVRARDVNPEPRCGPRLAEVGAGAPLTLRRSLILIITYVYHPDWRNCRRTCDASLRSVGAAIWLPAVVLPAVVLPARWRPAGGGPAGGAGGLLAVLLV